MFEKKARFSIRMRRYCVRARRDAGDPLEIPQALYIK